MTAVGLQYLKTVGNKTTTDQGFNYVTPNEQTFPGIFFFIILINDKYIKEFNNTMIMSNKLYYKILIYFELYFSTFFFYFLNRF